MKQEIFTRKDGTEGFNLKLEVGDVIEPIFETPRVTNNNGFENYSLGIKGDTEEEIVYVKLTKGQYDQCIKIGDLRDKKLKAEEYTNKFGTFIGLKVA